MNVEQWVKISKIGQFLGKPEGLEWNITFFSIYKKIRENTDIFDQFFRT